MERSKREFLKARAGVAALAAMPRAASTSVYSLYVNTQGVAGG
jgi:hypothetical protein